LSLTLGRYAMLAEFVLWGYHPAHGPSPIKVASGSLKDCQRSERQRQGEGWLFGTYRGGDEPTGLRAMVLLRKYEPVGKGAL
jgi:hypothetical protein